MKMPDFDYHRPATLDEALHLLAGHAGEAKVLAGGQSLLPVMALRLSHPRHIVDIGRVPGLAVLEEDPAGDLRVGATVRHADVERSRTVAGRHPVLVAATGLIGHPAVRSRGTTCGSLAHADPAAELPALALAVDAQLVVRSVAGERVIAARDFFVSFLTTALQPDELLVEVRFPAAAAGLLGSIQEVSRRHGDFALVGVCCAVGLAGDGTVTSAGLSFFGVGATPVRAAEAEKQLVGQRLDDTVIEAVAHEVAGELEPGDDIHCSAAYRRHVAGRLTARALGDVRRQGGDS